MFKKKDPMLVETVEKKWKNFDTSKKTVDNKNKERYRRSISSVGSK